MNLLVNVKYYCVLFFFWRIRVHEAERFESHVWNFVERVSQMFRVSKPRPDPLSPAQYCLLRCQVCRKVSLKLKLRFTSNLFWHQKPWYWGTLDQIGSKKKKNSCSSFSCFVLQKTFSHLHKTFVGRSDLHSTMGKASLWASARAKCESPV